MKAVVVASLIAASLFAASLSGTAVASPIAPPLVGAGEAGALREAGAVQAVALREAGKSGSLDAVLAAIGGSAEILSPSAVPLRLGSQANALEPQIRLLLAALERADALIRTSVEPSWRANANTLIRDLMNGSLRPDVTGADGRAALAPRLVEASRHTDIGVMLSAARTAAVAIDGLIEAARSQGIPGAGPSSASATDCDQGSVGNLLCISGDGAHTHAAEYSVQVDLGGDDAYSNHAGVGTCIAADATGLCTGIVVDLGGDDRYEPSGPLGRCAGALGASPWSCGQGVGINGLGALVDVSGDDTYLVRADQLPGDCQKNFATCGIGKAQGAGLFGVGILADLGGNDTYRAWQDPAPAGAPRDSAVSLDGQGQGTLGVGVLWDAEGNDDYTMSAFGTGKHSGNSISAWTTLEGQGHARAGVALLIDGAGDDGFTITTDVDPASAARTNDSPYGQGASSGSGNGNGGQGWGIGAGAEQLTLGALITGPGRQHYTIDMASRFSAGAEGQGYGSNGRLDDEGGDDIYDMIATTDATYELRCAACSSLEAAIDDRAGFQASQFGAIRMYGQGASAGHIIDRGGDDTYRARARVRLVVRAINDSPGGSARAIASQVGYTQAYAQASGGGELTDLSGNDTYDLDAEQIVSAVADATVASATVRPYYLSANAQAAGGRLTDLGGMDRYAVRAVERGVAVPATPGAANDGWMDVAAHALGEDGDLRDVDSGELDTFHADSSLVMSPCRGTYGTAPSWSGGVRRTIDATQTETCSSSKGAALISSAAARVAPGVVSLTAAPLVGAPDVTSISVRLTDAAGEPVAGGRVRVVLQPYSGYPYYGIGPSHAWGSSWWARELITGADGTVQSTIVTPPCTESGCPSTLSVPTKRRLKATAFGDANYGPAETITALVN